MAGRNQERHPHPADKGTESGVGQGEEHPEDGDEGNAHVLGLGHVDFGRDSGNHRFKRIESTPDGDSSHHEDKVTPAGYTPPLPGFHGKDRADGRPRQEKTHPRMNRDHRQTTIPANVHPRLDPAHLRIGLSTNHCRNCSGGHSELLGQCAFDCLDGADPGCQTQRTGSATEVPAQVGDPLDCCLERRFVQCTLLVAALQGIPRLLSLGHLARGAENEIHARAGRQHRAMLGCPVRLERARLKATNPNHRGRCHDSGGLLSGPARQSRPVAEGGPLSGIHILRHTAAKLRRDAGESIKDVSALGEAMASEREERVHRDRIPR